MISDSQHVAHGLLGRTEEPDWAPLTLAEADALLRGYPAAGGAERLMSVSPRPFSAASVVETRAGEFVFVKRHHRSVRDREGLMEEHRLIAHLAASDWGGTGRLVALPMADDAGETVVARDEWTYEVHPLARGVDVYERALSWTPFLSAGHAMAAGRAMAQMHLAAEGYAAPARKVQQLVSSFTIFSGAWSEDIEDTPEMRMQEYLSYRPELSQYAEERKWRDSLHNIHMFWYQELKPWLEYLTPLWTHNDFHASNLMWSDAGADGLVTGIVDFGLCDLTNRVHDLATAIERNVVEWLRMDDPSADIVRLDDLDALLAGYEDVTSLSYEEARALVAMLPLVHCEFALSETDYFLSVLHSPEKAYLAYEGYFLAHAEWFHSAQGERLLGRLREWAETKAVRS